MNDDRYREECEEYLCDEDQLEREDWYGHDGPEIEELPDPGDQGLEDLFDMWQHESDI
jgi:hypothetical protein